MLSPKIQKQLIILYWYNFCSIWLSLFDSFKALQMIKFFSCFVLYYICVCNIQWKFSYFFSSINKYGVKFLSLILVYEILNIYKLRLLDYFILNSVKKLEPCVPSPYYCLSKINKNRKKYCFIDFVVEEEGQLNILKK